jgi:hypothetical protein
LLLTPLVVAVSSSSLLAQQTGALTTAVPVSAPWNAATMDFVVSRQIVGGDGRANGIAKQTSRYHLDVSAAPAGWRTHLTIAHGTQSRTRWDGATVTDDPIGSIRVEDEGDGSPVRVFDRNGHEIRLPSNDVMARIAAGVPSLGEVRTQTFASTPPRQARFGRDWIAQMVATAPERGNRLRAVANALGKPAGRVGGLDLYVRQGPDRTVEELVDPDAGVVRETRVTAGGKRVLTMSTQYRRDTDGSLVKQTIHLEQAISGSSSASAIVDVEVENVAFERRGR